MLFPPFLQKNGRYALGGLFSSRNTAVSSPQNAAGLAAGAYIVTNRFQYLCLNGINAHLLIYGW